MLLLVVDTAGPAGGVLFGRVRGDNTTDESLTAESLGVIELHPRQFSAELIPAIGSLLRAGERRLEDLDAVAVVAGPGSFTGLRVGLSAVKALAEVSSKPILTLSRLAILASMAAGGASSEIGDAAVHVVLDAGRGEFYYGMYRDAGKTCVVESFETLASLTERIRQQPGWVIVSEASARAALEAMAGSRLREVSLPSVRDAVPLAVEEWRAGRFHDPAGVDANYLRRSDAVVVVRAKAEAAVNGGRAADGTV